MGVPHRPGPTRLAFAVFLPVLLVFAGDPWAAAAQPSTARAPAAVQQGARLFVGQARFENGGPPCGSCHQVSNLTFPNGGTVGPDLSAAYETLGPEGTDVTLQTLFFPTMMPLYEKRPLTPAEQQAIKALLQQAAPAGPPGRNTVELAGFAAAGFLVLIALAWLAWRHRLRAVRAPLVRRATAGGVRR
jgi:hypothetical protein